MRIKKIDEKDMRINCFICIRDEKKLFLYLWHKRGE